MRAINHKKLVEEFSRHPQECTETFGEALMEGDINPYDISIRRLTEQCLGRQFVEACDPANAEFSGRQLLAEADGVQLSTFSNITGQIIYSQVMQTFTNAAFVGSQLVPTIPTRLEGEKIPGIAWGQEVAPEVGEGMPYPHIGLQEDYIEVPAPRKHGWIIGLTREAIFFDRTNLLVTRAQEVGERLGIKKEQLIMDAIIGYGGGSTPAFDYGGKWKWKGTEYDVYETNTVDWSSYFYTNAITDTLTDHTDIDAATLLWGEMQDPNSREPILMSPTMQLLVPPALEGTAQRIANSLEIRTTTGTNYQAIQTNPYSDVKPVVSRYMFRRLVDTAGATAAEARAYWILGDIGRAFAWMENWPLGVRRAPENESAEFDSDIAVRFRADFKGIPAVLKPQYVIRSTGAG